MAGDSLWRQSRVASHQPPHRVDEGSVLRLGKGSVIIALELNAYGKIDSSFDCEVTSRVTAGTWSVEMGLALGEIESYPRLNVAVVSPNTRTRYSWSVTYGSPSNADRYGELRTESSE